MRGLQRRGRQGRALAQPRQTLRGRIVGSRFALALLPVHRGRPVLFDGSSPVPSADIGLGSPALMESASDDAIMVRHRSPSPHRSTAPIWCAAGLSEPPLSVSSPTRSRFAASLRASPSNRPSRLQTHVVRELLRVALVVLLQGPRRPRLLMPGSASRNGALRRCSRPC